MKRRATKEEILLLVQNLIARDGISAVRVDEIAQRVGISKRTLYELFEDKNRLVESCLVAMNRQQQQRIAACRRRTGHALHRVLRLTDEYIEGLFSVDRRFLTDIRQKVVFADHYDEHRAYWIDELTRHLETAREERHLLPEIDIRALVEQIVGTLFELRLNHAAREELQFFCRTMIRGAASRTGIELLDSRPAPQQS